jgi:hypothetical protein
MRLLRINAVIVDSAALLLRLGAWALMVWAPLAAFAQFFLVTRNEGGFHASPEVVVASSLVIPALIALGLASRWLSMGLVQRRRAQLLLVGMGASLCVAGFFFDLSWIRPLMGILGERLARFPSMPGLLLALSAVVGVATVSSAFLQPEADSR